MEPGHGIICDGCRVFAWRNGELVMENDKLKAQLKAVEKVLDWADSLCMRVKHDFMSSGADRCIQEIEAWRKGCTK
jgi:hypothetical protein